MGKKIIFFIALGFASCTSFINVDSAKNSKNSATEFSIIGAVNSSSAVEVAWTKLGKAENYEFSVAESYDGKECKKIIVKFTTTDASAKFENVSSTVKYICLRAKIVNSDTYVIATNNGYKIGDTPITATLAVTATASTISVGNSSQLKAVISYSNGTTKDVTTDATWSSDATSIATIVGSVATGVAVGSAKISATYNSTIGSTTLDVTYIQTFGTLVTSFGNNSGSTNFDYSGTNTTDSIGAVIQTSDGGYVGVGTAGVGGVNRMAIAKFTSTGILDTSFATGGKIDFAFPTAANTWGSAIALQPSGKIIAGGNYILGFGGPLAFVRLLSDGTFDTTFGASGYSEIDAVNRVNAAPAPHHISMLSDGSFISMGVSNLSGNIAFGVAKVTVDGSADTAGYSATLSYDHQTTGNIANPGSTWFGTGGVYTGPSAILKTYSDGSILVSGLYHGTTPPTFYFVKYKANGGLDTSFNTVGYRSYQFPANWVVHQNYQSVMQSDGKIVVLGRVSIAGTEYTGIARFNSDFTIDTSFATNGFYYYSFGDAYNYARGLLMQPDGRILAISEIKVGNHQIGIARFNSDGQIDTTYGTSGYLTVPLPAGVTSIDVNRAILNSENAIIVVGGAYVGGIRNFFITKIQ